MSIIYKTLEVLKAKPENAELLDLLKAHDHTSYIHSLSVAGMAELMYPVFAFKGIKNSTEIIEGALLHDVGKLFVSAEILKKEGKLTPLEKCFIKEHPRCGGILLHDRSEIVKNIVHFHHERLDGSGYPYGLKAEQIPDYCRYITAIDIMDALLSRRSYKEPLSLYQIKGELEKMRSENNLDMFYFDKIYEFLTTGILLPAKEVCAC